MIKWLPIEDASMDGTPVFVFPPTHRNGVTVARYDSDKYSKKPRPYWNRSDTTSMRDNRDMPPTHYAHIPHELLQQPHDQKQPNRWHDEDTYLDRLESEIREECRNG